jgi:hypothetical protein
MADALDSKSGVRKGVRVRLPPPVPPSKPKTCDSLASLFFCLFPVFGAQTRRKYAPPQNEEGGAQMRRKYAPPQNRGVARLRLRHSARLRALAALDRMPVCPC